MNYIVIGRDYPDSKDRRQAMRSAHLEDAKQMKADGKLLYAVALLEAGEMKGSVLIFDFESEKELDQWKAREPYITGKVWEHVEISACAIPPIFNE